MDIKLATASAVALALVMGGPVAAAQHTAPAPDDVVDAEPELDVADPAEVGVVADPDAVDPEAEEFAWERLTVADLDDLFAALEVEERELFFGSVVHATTEDRRALAMLVAQDDFALVDEEHAAAFTAFPAMSEALMDAGFERVQQMHELVVMQGQMDGHTVFAVEADRARMAARMAEQPADEALGAEDVRTRLGDAGIEVRDDVEAELFRAHYEDRPVFMLFAPEGVEAGAAVEYSPEEIRDRLEDAGLTDVEHFEEDIHFVRGQYEDYAVLAISGDLFQDFHGPLN